MTALLTSKKLLITIFALLIAGIIGFLTVPEEEKEVTKVPHGERPLYGHSDLTCEQIEGGCGIVVGSPTVTRNNLDRVYEEYFKKDSNK